MSRLNEQKVYLVCCLCLFGEIVEGAGSKPALIMTDPFKIIRVPTMFRRNFSGISSSIL